MLPELSTARLLGSLNDAAVPVPSANDVLPEPASVVTEATRPAMRLVGAFGTKPGITPTELDAGPMPMALLAVTLIVMDTLLVSPLIVHPVEVVVHDWPELAVAV